MTAIEELTVERVHRRVPGVPRRARRAEGGGTALRVGRGRRRRRHLRGGGPEPRKRGSWRRPRSGGPPATTPASAGSPARPSSAAGGSRRATAAPTRHRGRVRDAARHPSSASGSAWWRPTILAHATDVRAAGVPPGHVPRRHRRLPAVQRAGRRLRPGRPADPGRARRRRVADHRAEGVDVGRAVQRHRRDHLPHRSRPAEAPRPHRLRRGHAGAGRRGAAAAPDDRRRLVQRGLLHRGPRARRPPPRRRQRRVDGRAHHPDERAGLDRRR